MSLHLLILRLRVLVILHNKYVALARVAQLVGASSHNWKVLGSIFGPGTCDTWSEPIWEATDWCSSLTWMFLSLTWMFLSLPQYFRLSGFLARFYMRRKGVLWTPSCLNGPFKDQSHRERQGCMDALGQQRISPCLPVEIETFQK